MMVKHMFPVDSKGRDCRSIDWLQLEPGEVIPLHHHARREESYICLDGSGIVTVNKIRYVFKMGTSIFIPKGCAHSVENIGLRKLLFYADNVPGAQNGDTTFV